MDINSFEQLFSKLFSTTESWEARKILECIGDHTDVGLDKKFGSLNLFWHPYGNNEYNIGIIGVASKPGRSLTERITNGIDAILEDRFETSSSMPTSPQRAASEWFGRPVSGPDSGLHQWAYADGNYDRKVNVVLNKSQNKEAPTIDVIDLGIGITTESFPETILSLQQGNKMTKKYLAGAFGQGGASTLAFCEYVLIFSKHKSSPNSISFTLIRKVKLSDDYKEDCFAFLAVKNSKGEIIVPFFDSPHNNNLEIYPEAENIKPLIIQHGTVVRHYDYQLTNLAGVLGPQTGNLYHYFQYTMFDTLLPFRVIDRRPAGKEKDEIIKGSRNRLMEYTTIQQAQQEDSRTQLRHYRPMEFVTPSGSTEPCIGIEYWVIFNYEKRKNGELSLRGDSNALFLQRKHPIVFTLNGQNQGELSFQIFKQINLPLVSRHIIVHVDASKVTKDIRTNLFATNREGLKEGPVLESIKLELERMLQEDKELENLEKELVEKITSKETEETDDEVNKQIVKLLVEAGFTATHEGEAPQPGDGEMKKVDDKKKRKIYIKPNPLPTLPFPQVTKFEIVTPIPKMEVRLSGTEIVLVETDADAEFDRRGLVAIRFEPDILQNASKAPLRGGRVRWRLRPKETAEKWTTGKIITTITKLDGTQLQSETSFETLPALEMPSKPSKGIVPPFKIIPICPEDTNWNSVWEDIEAESEETSSVAYKAITTQGITYVYYSTIFTPFKEQCDKLKNSSEAFYNLFVTNYKVWIGYHAILQLKSEMNEQIEDVDEDKIEKERESERARVAQMEVKQALKSAELMQKLSKQETIITD